jgi:hypothetical protein
MPTNPKATDTAQAIVDDLRGAAYYKDPKILAEFLQNTLGGSAERSSQVAAAILDDLRGAAYYKDPKILAGFLEGQFGLRKLDRG